MRIGTALAAALAPVAALALAAALGGCSGELAPLTSVTGPEPPRAASNKQRLRQLRATEQALRDELRPREQPPWIDVSGADPYRIVAWPERSGFLGLLRGARALVSLS